MACLVVIKWFAITPGVTTRITVCIRPTTWAYILTSLVKLFGLVRSVYLSECTWSCLFYLTRLSVLARASDIGQLPSHSWNSSWKCLINKSISSHLIIPRASGILAPTIKRLARSKGKCAGDEHPGTDCFLTHRLPILQWLTVNCGDSNDFYPSDLKFGRHIGILKLKVVRTQNGWITWFDQRT